MLCSTSVGQEGLDFDLYCHAVVHWNLPSNPVDLEQREGRVHRYKGHAIRKNAALVYSEQALSCTSVDPWETLFELAKEGRPVGASDLVPYWVLPAEGGATIERHILALPLSRDVDRAAALRKTLTVYRMAFGQNRQDDFIAYLTNRFSAEDQAPFDNAEHQSRTRGARAAMKQRFSGSGYRTTPALTKIKTFSERYQSHWQMLRRSWTSLSRSIALRTNPALSTTRTCSTSMRR